MELLTKEICQQMPELRANDNKKAEEQKVIVKFFAPWNQWTWYATEASGFKDGKFQSLQKVDWAICEDVKFFGYVVGDFSELGYFMLSELLSVTGFMGLKIERDLYFGNKTLADVMNKVGGKV